MKQRLSVLQSVGAYNSLEDAEPSIFVVAATMSSLTVFHSYFCDGVS